MKSEENKMCILRLSVAVDVKEKNTQGFISRRKIYNKIQVEVKVKLFLNNNTKTKKEPSER